MNRIYDLDRFAARLCQHIRRTAVIPGSAESPCAPYPLQQSDTCGLEAVWFDFNEWAVELFHLQFEFNSAYRQQCLAQGISANQIQSWDQIPAVPAAAFKEIELSCLVPAEQTTVFFSSGTTEQRASRHFHSANSLRVYHESLTTWFSHQFSGGYPAHALALTPDGPRTPHSSLVHMFETLRRDLRFDRFEFAGEVQPDGTWCVNEEVAINFLQNAEAAGNPVLILGTAFSYVHLLDCLRRRDLRFRLPVGSSVMETGGYKGRSRSLTKPELYAYITERLGLPEASILSEYGMSELSSQAYDRSPRVGSSDGSGAGSRPKRRFRFPPWARAQLISPETGREVLPGQAGLIRVFDLANVYSVLAIQTEDLGIDRPDKPNGSSMLTESQRKKENSPHVALYPGARGEFELLGRSAIAEPRGCSLMTSESTS
jgi:hypothetical protein